MPLPESGKSLRIQLTALFPLEMTVYIDFFAHEGVHLLGDGATRPTEPLNMSSSGALGRCSTLRAVARCVVAPSQHIPMTAHSDVSNCRF